MTEVSTEQIGLPIDTDLAVINRINVMHDTIEEINPNATFQKRVLVPQPQAPKRGKIPSTTPKGIKRPPTIIPKGNLTIEPGVNPRPVVTVKTPQGSITIPGVKALPISTSGIVPLPGRGATVYSTTGRQTTGATLKAHMVLPTQPTRLPSSPLSPITTPLASSESLMIAHKPQQLSVETLQSIDLDRLNARKSKAGSNDYTMAELQAFARVLGLPNAINKQQLVQLIRARKEQFDRK